MILVPWSKPQEPTPDQIRLLADVRKSMSQKGVRVRYINRNHDYRFAFENLQPGTYVLFIAPGSHWESPNELLGGRRVEVRGGTTFMRFDYPKPARSSYIEVQVVGPDDRILRDAEVGTGFRVGETVGHVEARDSSCDPDGIYRVPITSPPSADRADAGEVKRFVRVSAPNLGSVVSDFAMGPEPKITIRLKETARVNFRLEDLNEEISEGVVVRLRPLPDSAWTPTRPPLPMEDIRFLWADETRFDPVQPGEYLIEMIARYHSNDECAISSEVIHLESGEAKVSMRMPKLNSLRVRAPGMKVGLTVFLRLSGNREACSLEAELDHDGQVLFNALPEGKFDIQVGSGLERMKSGVELDHDQVIEIPERTKLDFVVVIKKPDSAAATAGLRSRDRILAVDHRLLPPDVIPIRAFLMSILKDTAVLRVLRDGKELSIPIRPGQLAESFDKGEFSFSSEN